MAFESNPTPAPTPAPKPPAGPVIGAFGGSVMGGLLVGVLAIALWVAANKHSPEPPAPVPDISVPANVQAQAGIIIDIPDIHTTASELDWYSEASPGPYSLRATDSGRAVIFAAPLAGRYCFVVYGVVNGHLAGPVHCCITVGTPAPPAPPTPPTPPKPPEPPAPIPGDGLRVLIVYDSAALGKMPPAQRDVMYSESVRGWLSAHVAKGTDGRSTEWRVLDQHEDMAGESPTWQDAMKLERKSLPWIVISNGKTGFEGPLPVDVDQTMQLLQKYAGG